MQDRRLRKGEEWSAQAERDGSRECARKQAADEQARVLLLRREIGGQGRRRRRLRLEVRPYALERLGVGNEVAVNVLVDREDVRTRAEVPLPEVHAER